VDDPDAIGVGVLLHDRRDGTHMPVRALFRRSSSSTWTHVTGIAPHPWTMHCTAWSETVRWWAIDLAWRF
jgi:hypothetical protein